MCLDEDQRRSIDRDLTVPEIYDAIKALHCGKTPGYDGLTAEVFQLFPYKWAQVMRDQFFWVLNYATSLPTS
jgi:hypothetical protein